MHGEKSVISILLFFDLYLCAELTIRSTLDISSPADVLSYVGHWGYLPSHQKPSWLCGASDFLHVH